MQKKKKVTYLVIEKHPVWPHTRPREVLAKLNRWYKCKSNDCIAKGCKKRILIVDEVTGNREIDRYVCDAHIRRISKKEFLAKLIVESL